MNLNWLADQQNQEVIYTICARVVAEIAPDESSVLEEIFPAYMEAALEGEVVIQNRGLGEPFAFGGDGLGDLFALIIIPFIINIVSSLLLSGEKPNPSNDDPLLPVDLVQLRARLNPALVKYSPIPEELLETIIEITVECLNTQTKENR